MYIAQVPASARRTLYWLVLFWCLAAVAVVSTGLLGRLPIFSAQISIASQIAAFAAILLFMPELRRHLFSGNLRVLTSFHAWRVIPGAAFLYYYYSLSELPWSFAVPGGYGDLLVGLTGIPMSVIAVNPSRQNCFALLVWQVLGFMDLMAVVRAALVNGLHNPESMRPLTHFPLSVLPTILVPLTLMIHVISIIQVITRLKTAAVPIGAPIQG